MEAVLESLRLGLVYLWKALWPILFGVLLTAAIDAFVDQDRLAGLLGGRDPGTTARAGLFGALSSACTFGAVTVAHSLFKKGASAESTFAFSFGATNLVVELGILIYVLMGPAFLAAELVGGVVLIAIMYLIVRSTLPEATFERARERLRAEDEESGGAGFGPEDPSCGYMGDAERTLEHEGTTYRFCSESCREAFRQRTAARGGWKEQLKGLGGWYRVASNFFNTLDRIYASVLGGFLAAGFIVGLVPQSVWRTLFVEPTTLLGVTENALMGVAAAVLSFIGSIGNVPFAFGLWAGGVSFAGVIACIYGDLITVPVMNLWRKFYGNRAAAYVFGVFFVTMAASAVLMEVLFGALGWIPARPAAGQAAFEVLQLDHTMVLNALALAGVAALWAVRRRGLREGVDEVRDPVCGMKIERRQAAASREHGGETFHFCARACTRSFEREPERYAAA